MNLISQLFASIVAEKIPMRNLVCDKRFYPPSVFIDIYMASAVIIVIIVAANNNNYLLG